MAKNKRKRDNNQQTKTKRNTAGKLNRQFFVQYTLGYTSITTNLQTRSILHMQSVLTKISLKISNILSTYKSQSLVNLRTTLSTI